MSPHRGTLPGSWFTTRQVAAVAGLSEGRAATLLHRLSKAGVIARTVRGDGARLWRLPPEAVRELGERNPEVAQVPPRHTGDEPAKREGAAAAPSVPAWRGSPVRRGWRSGS